MVSIIRSESFLSLESRGGNLTLEEELDHYRQRFQSMKLVLKELQQQVGQYKTRCSGVNTVALMLKESKQEVRKLTKQKQALETAVANLQNRLSTNGLSSSVNIEETEPFLPGASKQTLDNLARENGRLRSLLKSLDGQSGLKSLEELQTLKVSLENLEAENRELRTEISEFEDIKKVITSQFEEIIAKLKQEHEADKLIFEQELSLYKQEKTLDLLHRSVSDVEIKSTATSSEVVEPIKIDEIRRVLKLVCDQCKTLDMSLENAHNFSYQDNKSIASDKVSIVTEEAYMELEKRLSQVIQMNQRWQTYSHTQEEQAHGFLARIAELEQLTQEGETLRNVANAKEIENQDLRKEVDKLTRETNKLWSQPQFDASIVEILKQQIQVCTEDFNTERKDREHAINRIKQLEEEISKLANENDSLRKDNDNMRRIKSMAEHYKHESQKRPQEAQYFTPKGGPISLQRIPLFSSTGALTSATSSVSPAPSPGQSFMSTSSVVDRSSIYPPSSHDSANEFQSPARLAGNKLPSSYGYDSRGYQEGAVSVAKTLQKPAATHISMLSLNKRAESPARVKNRQTDLTCPRCNKEFTDSELINHIDKCTD